MRSPDLAHPADLLARAAKIKLACFDVDGTLTDGRLYFDSEGRESKAFHVLDGQGLVLLRKHGIHVAFVTARASGSAERRAADLGVEACIGVQDKLACVTGIAQRLGIGLEQASFMGDDLPDLAVMYRAGLSVAPANAHGSVLAYVHWRTQARGGEGAAREFCDLLLEAQGLTERVREQALAQ
ncbi:phenylphosphate carboxylase subunit delta [Luteimonas gilva]|uniref:3-deoxy-D-manno-octulosonate 8-phosphate phosphatase KdsC n=1 Tax=Luteimonas gilva TaxID=2572684 RepID=A0A4U5JMJ0_9GAMM|nr:HAD hydrolase family protein [Luteimonas gilva]TKR30910.1 phenylphosphate carboxylase subunit delta [Luteimonas gilva]